MQLISIGQFHKVIEKYLYWLSLPSIGFTDILEIIIISVIVYQMLKWVQLTRAWTLFKGIIMLLLFALFAAIFQLNTISWLLSNSLGVGITAAIIIFQPELRRALEQLGRKKIFSNLFSFSTGEYDGRQSVLTEKTINEIVRASYEMGAVKTGALMVIEQNVALGEYVRTGISIDGIVSSQLLINIFEHNTPLHDGAVIIRGNRIVSATCYLPLTDSMDIGKELGTRHRAAVGISEVSDSLTIIVSEETGAVSLAKDGKNIFADENDTLGLSEDAYHFIAGLMKHAKGMAALTNPLVNSYKRLVPGYEAPVYIAWSVTNRSPLIRIPASRGQCTRVELRNPDPSANPYLVLATCLAAGLDGIKNKLEVPASVDCNIFEMTDEERKHAAIEVLPESLYDAVRYLNEDKFICDVLGEHITSKYTEAKLREWNDYKTQVTQWELDEYLYKF